MAILKHNGVNYLCPCAVARKLLRYYGAVIELSTKKKFVISVGDRGYDAFLNLTPNQAEANLR